MTRRDEWFGTVTGDVAFDPTLKPSAKTVYLVLVMYRNAETNECFPSNETIASHTGMSTRSVIRALERANHRARRHAGVTSDGLVAREALVGLGVPVHHEHQVDRLGRRLQGRVERNVTGHCAEPLVAPSHAPSPSQVRGMSRPAPGHMPKMLNSPGVWSMARLPQDLQVVDSGPAFGITRTPPLTGRSE